ncbi:cysteine--tRNA ligase [Burkholderia gladioli]|uniref:cysteine--tRNA ligase n=1 Tax=Burkholderia gladioli TaxID=28095 RepID=UPI001640F073|nr:cysteine--tRNA ligase [Burkholderia gladioli]
MNAPIQLYNTLTREKSPLRTPVPGRVTLYVGGPTLHDHAHLGNVRPAVVFDVLARLLRLHYPDVLHVGRLADVDDRIHAAALAAGESVKAFTARYRDAWREDLDALGVLAPDVEPRASEQVAGVVEQSARLLERGHAYIEAGHVLFHVPSYPGHGRLCGRPVEDMIALARGEPVPRRRHPLDFVLWKPAEHGFPAWPSPWGAGRPGWHAQSTAVLERELGREIDIHGGGQDLIHPHHENEIAQLACANGMPPSRTWLHNAFLTVNWQKMSKPLRNVVTLRELRERAPGEAIRLALLSVHYRQPLNWNLQRLSSARRTLTRGYHVLAAARDTRVDTAVEPDEAVLAALRNDLNVPAALVRLNGLLAAVDGAATESARIRAKSRLLASARLLGLLQRAPESALRELGAEAVPRERARRAPADEFDLEPAAAVEADPEARADDTAGGLRRPRFATQGARC